MLILHYREFPLNSAICAIFVYLISNRLRMAAKEYLTENSILKPSCEQRCKPIRFGNGEKPILKAGARKNGTPTLTGSLHGIR
jgi:hypothetical protein